MLSNDDPDGRLTFFNAAVYAAALLPVSLTPTILGVAGTSYFVGALLLSAGFLAASVRALRSATAANARKLFRYSLAYLPALLILMGIDRTV